jgi:hypothetical protein
VTDLTGVDLIRINKWFNYSLRLLFGLFTPFGLALSILLFTILGFNSLRHNYVTGLDLPFKRD